VVTTVSLKGLQTGETLVGIDIRPATGTLYGVGNSNRLYTINALTGTTVQIGVAGGFTLSGSFFGTDFNPLVDRLRVVSNTQQNLRLNPNDGSLLAADTALSPPGRSVVGIAYDRNYQRGPGDITPTTLYGVDATAGTLVLVGGINGTPSPNGGVLTSVGSLTVGTNLDSRLGFDISGISGTAFATILTGGTAKLYSVNLGTGAATLIGTIGTGNPVYVGLAAVPEPNCLLSVGAALLLARRRRSSSASEF
jgi:hypothetical protein